MAKEGSTIGGLMDCFGTAVSMSLQYGVPLEVYVSKFSHTRFEPWGHTKNPDIRIAKSIVDYIFRWLGITFLPGYREVNNGVAAPPGNRLEGTPEDSEAEPGPAAKTAGGQDAGQGSAASSSARPRSGSGNGSPNGSGNGSHRAKSNGSSRVAEPTAQAVAPTREGGGVALQEEAQVAWASPSEQYAAFQQDAPSCDQCGAITVRSGTCYLCRNCGNSMGCS
jgi:ribonucleoside-diphosphate reductase alpha chain